MTKLFDPIVIGRIQISHRVVLAPMTRLRCNSNGVPPARMAEYYAQRASTPGTFMISEGTIVAPKAGGFPHGPGIWSEEQIEAWKKVTDAVHEKGSYIYMQLAAIGRRAMPNILAAMTPPHPYTAPSAVPLEGMSEVPRAFTKDEIKEYIQLFVTAAKNAIRAGFDGVELHGANGFLLDQFLSSVTNIRDDEYGGSVQGRARFNLDLVDSVADAIGAENVGYRISPWNTSGDLRMDDTGIKETFTYFVTELRDRQPNLAYLHVVEPQITSDGDVSEGTPSTPNESNDFIREIWAPRPLISAGGYNRDTALKAAEAWPNQLITFGRYFISNPDLPRRLKEDLPLNKYDRSTFYVMGDDSPKGYTDYPFYSS